MKNSIDEKIIAYISQKNQASPIELVGYLSISRQTVAKKLKKLIEQGKLSKTGAPPKVFYSLASPKELTANKVVTVLAPDIARIINERYLYTSPAGEMKEGVAGFNYWCNKTGQPVKKTAQEYIHTLAKYDAYKKHGYINGMKKFRSTFTEIFLDEIFYLDFYSIERFGKTRLGQLLLYAKQGQNRRLMNQLVNDIRPHVEYLIAEYRIDAIGFIPPTVKREVQLMHELKRRLAVPQRNIALTKVTSDVAVPQKTLSKLEDRIENANKTILLTEKQPEKNILLIDDAVGSGATLNEVAQKLRTQNLCTGKIIGLAITGSFKRFDVVSEV
ncbi:MAG: DeoR family transcriptional regulator [Candidatus Kerfeldbacteria bacterium]|nr:DeoR family transcriptional regulator [Candidatus Kerfeldbacteria bacterium]